MSNYNIPPAPPAALAYNGPPKKSGCGCGCMGCLSGCLVMLFVVLIACGVGGYLVNKQVPTIIRETAETILRESNVAPEERDAIRVQVDRVATAYEKNTISWEQFADIATEFQGSPLLDTIMLMAVEEQYLKPSQLNDEEKYLGLKVLKRVARGAMEHQIDRDEIAQAAHLRRAGRAGWR